MEYASAIKKNEVVPFAATWMNLEIIIPSEVTQTEKDKSLNKQNLKDTNELIYKMETDSQEQKTKLWLPKEKEGWDKLGVLGQWMQTTVCGIDKPGSWEFPGGLAVRILGFHCCGLG